jgi:hypothetical protein
MTTARKGIEGESGGLPARVCMVSGVGVGGDNCGVKASLRREDIDHTRSVRDSWSVTNLLNEETKKRQKEVQGDGTVLRNSHTTANFLRPEGIEPRTPKTNCHMG